MSCQAFDGQVVRLEGIKDIADEFVRVRLTRIENVDLNLFEFDYDVTFMVFFLNAEKKVYGRYGGRDSESADDRQSLKGLTYTMQSELRMHKREDKVFAPKSAEAPRILKDPPGPRRDCLHCHQVREALNAELKTAGKLSREAVYHYPPPDNLGLELDVDRGGTVKAVKDRSPASVAGLKKDDVLQRLNGVPIHSFADAQFALDRAPKVGSIAIVWQRDDKVHTEKLALPEGWRKTDVIWRASKRDLLPSARLSGFELTDLEKKALGLSAKQLAFRQRDSLSKQAKEAGIRAGDIILGVDDKPLETDLDGFRAYIQNNYL
ncbi:MAG TPA: Trx7/PDZ domain-containing (seleno)protein, partial [Gemmataceae bacterium]